MMKHLFKISFVFCIVYGTIMFFTNITKTFFLIWMFLAIVFYIIYLMFKKGIIDKIPCLFRKIIIIFSTLIVFIVLINLFEIIKYYNKKPAPNLDYIIVLGALVTDRGPAMSTIYRLDEAIDYLNNNHNTKCILTGAKGDNEPDCESVIMAQYLIDNNIDKDRLILEKESFSTYENINNSKQFIDIDNDKIGIATNNFHVCRAIFLANKLGYKYVDGLASYSLPINSFSNLLRETMALIYYKVYFIILSVLH